MGVFFVACLSTAFPPNVWSQSATTAVALESTPASSLHDASSLASLLGSLTMRASFDHGVDADTASGDATLWNAPALNRRKDATKGLPASGEVIHEKEGGRFGGALRFEKSKGPMVFFRAPKNNILPPSLSSTSDWSGTISFWLSTDPAKDLAEGFCDPIQVTSKQWDDASIFVEFEKRGTGIPFRLGVYADKAVWNPTDRKFADIPAAEKPLVTVAEPPFAPGKWTHVAVVYSHFNTGKSNGLATLYLNGEKAGEISPRTQTFTWDPDHAAIMLGLGYIGKMDDLALFDRALTSQEVNVLYSLKQGVSDLATSDFPKLNAGTDWAFWRGPNRNGTSLAKAIPVRFGDKENVRWEVEIPGRSHASPTIVKDQIFLATADEKEQTQSVLSFDRETGKLRWAREVNRGGFPSKNHPKNTEATPTVVSDGENLYACFFHHKGIHLVTLDLQGNIVRNQKLGDFNPTQYEYGYAPSPCLYKDLLIACAEYNGESFLMGLERKTGKESWRVARPASTSFSSPVVASVAGKDQLLLSGNQKVSSYDPKTGTLLWDVDGTTYATCGTMIWEGDRVFASGGYPKSETIAVRADGSKEVLWKNDQKCYEQSMMVVNGYVYALTGKGVLYCWKGDDGKEMWKQRLQGPVSSSPILVGDRIYWANELGTHYVFKASPEKFELLAENKLGDESFASPAISGERLFLRIARGSGAERREYLVCISEGP